MIGKDDLCMFFTRFTSEKRPQLNFSRPNYSIENSHLYVVRRTFIAIQSLQSLRIGIDYIQVIF